MAMHETMHDALWAAGSGLRLRPGPPVCAPALTAGFDLLCFFHTTPLRIFGCYYLYVGCTRTSVRPDANP